MNRTIKETKKRIKKVKIDYWRSMNISVSEFLLASDLMILVDSTVRS